MMIHLFVVSLVCRDCKHFIADKQECIKFKHTDIVTGSITYDTAREGRSKLCGKDAILFEKNELKFLTEPYYFIKSNWASSLLIMYTIWRMI